MVAVSPLPITFSGIDILGPGCTWLQRNLVGRDVWFQPVAVTQRNQLECIVLANMVSVSDSSNVTWPWNMGVDCVVVIL